MVIRRKDENGNPRDHWESVSERFPCPVCGKPDNCKVSLDGWWCYCGREPSKRKQNAGGQFLHRLDVKQEPTSRRHAKKREASNKDWQALAEQYASKAGMPRQKLAKQLGVSVESLEILQVGWHESAWTFPECDAAGTVIGISRRLKNGDKRNERGSKRGLTFDDSDAASSDVILIVEGGTDTAAGLTLGLTTIGRPSASGGVPRLAELLAGVSAARQIIVLGENDEKENGNWPGREGAVTTAGKLAESLGRSIDWALPPGDAKDLRAWLSEHGEDQDGFLRALTVETIAPPDKGSAVESHATRLVEMVKATDAELFHSPDAEPFITFSVNGHNETHRLRSESFQDWLGRLSWEQSKKSVSSQVLDQAIRTLSGIAKYEGPEIETFVRIAFWEDNIWVDLADEQWRAINVTRCGWGVVANPPVRFTRSNGTRPLPVPESGGRLSELRRFVNVDNESDWVLLQAWLVGCYRPAGPYPLLALYGEQGSAKSTSSRMLRALIDPNKSPVRSTPAEVRDLMITATHSRLVAFDNLSHIREWLSDALCRLTTGGGFATRGLYSNDAEKIFDVQRPVLMNGINELSKRSDLLDRTIAVTLPAISESQRLPEAELWKQFKASVPRILGAILTAVSTALKNEDSVVLKRMPRMADFARWVVAAEPSLDCSPGDVMAAYVNNRAQASETAISISVIGEPILKLLEQEKRFEGTATELLKALRQFRSISPPSGWPRQPNALSGQLRRLVPNLRAVGWEVVWGHRDSKTRNKIIRIEQTPPEKKGMRGRRRRPK